MHFGLQVKGEQLGTLRFYNRHILGEDRYLEFIPLRCSHADFVVTRWVKPGTGGQFIVGGLGGAVLTVVQLKLYREGIIASRVWIAVALVIFARWKSGRALLGALLFGVADSLQYRIQALDQSGNCGGTIPYEFLLMLPYTLTIVALLWRVRRSDQPAELGRPYIKGAR